ncbi:Pentatricopeptide repeat-containing protein, partial [Cucurbita argyrosperma subsp. sororia]
MIRPLLFHIRRVSTLPLPTQDNLKSILFQCNKTILQLTKLGRLTEARDVFESMSQRDSVSWNSMIAGYAQNGLLREAKALFDAFRGKNVRTWTILLTGYARHGLIHEAVTVFESMPERNIVSWNAMISGYVQIGDLRTARKLFDEMPERNVVSWNQIITGYCHSGMVVEARELFDRMVERNSVSWMVMMSGYVEIGEYREAWRVFSRMLRSGARPDQATFVVAFSTVAWLDNLVLLGSLRTMAVKVGYESDVLVGTSILNAYTRNGSLETAFQFFEAMPEKNEYSWTTMISAFSQCDKLNDAIALYERTSQGSVAIQTAIITAFAQKGRIQEARNKFEEIVKPNVVAWNAMIAAYAHNGMLEEAKDTFLRMPVRNAVSWAAMIAGLAQNGQSIEALELFSDLQRSGTVPNHSTFTSALFACSNIGFVEVGRQIHALSIKMRCQFNLFVGNGLISMYAKCKDINGVVLLFNTMKSKDTVSWNSLISGFVENNMLDDAWKAFERMPERDVVSWTDIISAYAKARLEDVAFGLFHDMLSVGTMPNESTISALLSACASPGTTKLGEQIHALTYKLGLNSCLIACNAVITMYFKCGSLEGISVFKEMFDRDTVTWNAVLVGFAQNGLGKEAIEIFKQMEAVGILPNEITFIGVLCACSHAGLVDEGWKYFSSMNHHGITPSVEHYTCMVDLLGRAGKLSDAEALIETMPVNQDNVIWEALLGACRIHGNIELAQRVAERLLSMGTSRHGTYVILSNIYSFKGLWEKVSEIENTMKNKEVAKEPGASWIQIRCRVHYFLTKDDSHDEIEEIHSCLKVLLERLTLAGYVPETNFVLHDVEDEQKLDELLYHSEKLALAYGILNTPIGAPIHITKNLRICGDCHTFMKFVSQVTNRKIIIRDGYRFHHFLDGSCNCRDYW